MNLLGLQSVIKLTTNGNQQDNIKHPKISEIANIIALKASELEVAKRPKGIDNAAKEAERKRRSVLLYGTEDMKPIIL